MIRKPNGEYVVECDDCGEELAGGVIGDFREFIAHMKDLEWTVQTDDEEGPNGKKKNWLHYCPECSEED